MRFSSLGDGPHQARDLARIWVPPLLFLGKDQRTVYRNLERSPRRGDQLDLCALEFLLQLRRQTGGATFIVSNYAVLNHDVHEISGLVDDCESGESCCRSPAMARDRLR